jgi:hypothetical protein
LKAPLIAVISVGVAAAAPAVAISAKEPSSAPVQTTAGAVPDQKQPIEVALTTQTANADEKQNPKLVKRYYRFRKRLNHLVAKRDGRRHPKRVRSPRHTWSDHDLRHHIRLLRKRIRRVRAHLRAVAAVRPVLERIANCESHGNPRAIGGGGAFRGKYQFTYGTWAGVGGRGDPAAATESEQDRRAAILLRRTGGSAWPVCG